MTIVRRAARDRTTQLPAARVSEPAGWTTWIGTEEGTLERGTATRQHQKGEATYHRILHTARTLFTQHGYHATTIRAITIAAEVNVGAVSYHFGTKEELYHKILQGFTGRLTRTVTAVASLDSAPLRKIDALVRHLCTHIHAHDEMVPLLVREMAYAGEPAAPVRNMLQAIMPLIAGIITKGQATGEITAGNPLLLAAIVMALPVYVSLARRSIAAAAGHDPISHQFDRTVEHCVATARTALTR